MNIDTHLYQFNFPSRSPTAPPTLPKRFALALDRCHRRSLFVPHRRRRRSLSVPTHPVSFFN
jgi:hypothetical protein